MNPLFAGMIVLFLPALVCVGYIFVASCVHHPDFHFRNRWNEPPNDD
jgi:hypothetical protein